MKREAKEDWGKEGAVEAKCRGAVLSFERERELVFGRWLSDVEQLLGHQVDRDAAYAAWTDGYSAAEYVSEVVAR